MLKRLFRTICFQFRMVTNFDSLRSEIPSSAAKVEMSIDFRKLKILLVDDSLDNLLIISHFLRPTGAYLDTANNGLEGVAMAMKVQYDIVLMDLQMPVLDGYEAIHRLKRVGFSAPVIALTAHAMKNDRKRCLESGFADHLSKPVDRHLLVQTIFQSLKKSNDFYMAPSF